MFKFPEYAHVLELQIATNHRAWLTVKLEREDGQPPLTMTDVGDAMEKQLHLDDGEIIRRIDLTFYDVCGNELGDDEDSDTGSDDEDEDDVG